MEREGQGGIGRALALWAQHGQACQTVAVGAKTDASTASCRRCGPSASIPGAVPSNSSRPVSIRRGKDLQRAETKRRATRKLRGLSRDSRGTWGVRQERRGDVETARGCNAGGRDRSARCLLPTTWTAWRPALLTFAASAPARPHSRSRPPPPPLLRSDSRPRPPGSPLFPPLKARYMRSFLPVLSLCLLLAHVRAVSFDVHVRSRPSTLNRRATGDHTTPVANTHNAEYIANVTLGGREIPVLLDTGRSVVPNWFSDYADLL